MEYNENLNLTKIILSRFTCHEHLAILHECLPKYSATCLLINTKMTSKHSQTAFYKQTSLLFTTSNNGLNFAHWINVFVITHMNERFDIFKSISQHQFFHKRTGYIFIKGPIHVKLWSDIIRRHSHIRYEIPEICSINFKCLVILLFSILHTRI